jgi:biopolymer transport protein ExbB/TolQ
MELSTVANELYGLPLSEFTAARNARALEARRAGDGDLAEALKRLRKPSTGAAVANLLVREQPQEIERLIELGANLRGARNLDGARIRRATGEKADAVRKLLRQAKSIGKRAGLTLSPSVEQELETTLDAAFSDPDSAQSLREGCLTTILHYSGLGFGADETIQGSAARSQGSGRAQGGPGTAKAKQNLEQARIEAKQAASDVEKAQLAVKAAEAELHRLRAALTVAQRRTTRADEKASNAQKKLDLLRDK